jgi:dihydroorotase
MKIILKNVHVLSPGSKHHMKVKDLLINSGTIEKIADANSISEKDAQIIEGKNNYVSAGWFDLHVNFRDPGHEYKEGLSNGCKAAANGGYTGLLLMPSTEPAIASKASIEYVLQKTKPEIVDVIPAGTLSVNREGKDLSEMYDMSLAGTKVFTDDKRPISDSGLLIRALQYSHNFKGKIFTFAEDKYIAGKGQMNEGISSTQLGLKGAPALAEEVNINRDLFIAEYCNCPIHFSTISSAGSVALIRAAKAKGIKVTCDVAVVNLMFNDEKLSGFDTNFKVKPPLRTEDDRLALIDGLVDGTIDCITSDHCPDDVENKLKEFELANFGISSIDTAFAVARTATKDKLNLAELVSKFTNHPRGCAGQKTILIEEGNLANLTVFDPDIKWTVQLSDIKSASKITPFIGVELTGKPICVINKGMVSL